MVGHPAERLAVEAQHLHFADGSHRPVPWTRGEQADFAEALARSKRADIHVAVLDALDELRFACCHDVKPVSRLTLGHNDVTAPVPRPPQPARSLDEQRRRCVREGPDQPFVTPFGPVEAADEATAPRLTPARLSRSATGRPRSSPSVLTLRN